MRNAPYTIMMAVTVAIIASWVAATLLVVADLATAGEKKAEPNLAHFQLRLVPRILMVQPTQRPLLIALEQRGDDPADYCAGVDLYMGMGLERQLISSVDQDCEPWEDHAAAEAAYQTCQDAVCVVPEGFDCDKGCKAPKEVARQWSWQTGQGPGRLRLAFGQGHHEVTVVVRFANGRRLTLTEGFQVVGGE